MISSCERVGKISTKGLLLKCNDKLVAKIIRANDDSADYPSFSYISEHAPEIPAVRPHGLVNVDNFRILFMTNFPSMSLRSAWLRLTNEHKSSIQQQLNEIFLNIRSLPWDSRLFGGVAGEAVNDDHGSVTEAATSYQTSTDSKTSNCLFLLLGIHPGRKFLRVYFPPRR